METSFTAKPDQDHDKDKECEAVKSTKSERFLAYSMFWRNKKQTAVIDIRKYKRIQERKKTSS